MGNIILTPVTLWKDFDDTLPTDEEILSEREDDFCLHREVYFYGRQTGAGRVKIFAHWFAPKNTAEFPAVMVLSEAGHPADLKFMRMLVERGYAALFVDYCGEDGTEKHTVYPSDIDYANFVRAGGAMEYAEPTARETSWYEWAAVARYAAKYLSEKPEVTKSGAIGIRTGGEVLWKIAPFAPVDCMITICAAGWLAYRGMNKFGDGEKRMFDAERHRFIAGVDSQSYAPYTRCPVLLLCAINDKKYNYDRVYDTFQQINPEVEKAILFSAHGSGLIGSHSLFNLSLFLDKYLKGRSVYISKPVGVSAFEDENGNLVAKGTYDEGGEMKECGIFYTEKITDYKARDWTRVLGKAENMVGNTCTFPMSVYKGSEKALVYSFVRYSNGFSVTSKIQEIALKKQYANSRPKSRVVWSAADGLNGFSSYHSRTLAVADCFADSESDVRLTAGYGGIVGITGSSGLVSYRVGEPCYEPPESASFRFDAYSERDGAFKVRFFRGEEKCYTAELRLRGGGKWKEFVLEAGDFKAETGAPLSDFAGVTAVVFLFGGEILINNVVWL